MTIRRTTADCFRPFSHPKYPIKSYDYENLMKYWCCPNCGQHFTEYEGCKVHIEEEQG